MAEAPSGPWVEPGGGHLLPSPRLSELQGVLGEVGRVTGRAGRWSPEPPLDYAAARGVLAEAWEAVLEALGGAAPPAAGLVTVLRSVRALDDTIRDEGLTRREASFQRVREALARLRGAGTTAALVEEAAVAACGLGFDRAIVSRIESGYWIPESVHVGRDVTWAEEILAAGREHPQRLDSAVAEYEMVAHGVAILVSDVKELPSVQRREGDVPRARSYVAAPVVAHGNVIGFLHADCYYQRRDLDETDRLTLARFGVGLGHALARTAVLDRLEVIREDLAGLTASVATGTPSASWSGLSRLPADAADDDAGFLEAFLAPNEGETALTPREVDVLRRLAEGDTNGRIARRLVISEGTVKSHVKNILRKLGAANRAEAASRWRQAERRNPSPPAS